jgi:hypothetical protein
MCKNCFLKRVFEGKIDRRIKVGKLKAAIGRCLGKGEILTFERKH